jgi:ABC-type multidrug transport system permease subunit
VLELALKNIREFFRDKKLLLPPFLFPFFLILIHAVSRANQDYFSFIPLAVVNPEPSPPKAGALLVIGLEHLKLPNSGKPLIHVFVEPQKEAMTMFQKQDVAGVLIIPKHFTENLNKGKETQKLLLILNEQDNRAQLLRFEIQAFVRQVGFWIQKGKGEVSIQPVVVNVISQGAPLSNMDTQTYALFLMASFVSFVIFSAGMWIREFEQGSFFRFRLSHVPLFSLFSGSFLALLFLGLLEAFLLIVVLFLLQLKPYVLVVWIFPAVFFLMLATHGLGLLISSFVEKERQLQLLAPIIMLPLIFLPIANQFKNHRIVSFLPWYQAYKIFSNALLLNFSQPILLLKMFLSSSVFVVVGLVVFYKKRLKYG